MADETEIRPALTPGQWTSMHMAQVGADLEIRLTDEGSYGIRPPSLHAIAALALYKQPYGFTREMVSGLIDLANLVDPDDIEELVANAKDVAARIAALLPPHP